MKYIITALIVLLFYGCSEKIEITNNIEKIIKGKELKLGFAVYDFCNGELYHYNGDDAFPMQSVYKLPISMAVLNRVESGKLRLNDTIQITKDDLSPNLYSPIRNKYPEGVDMLLSELILYTVAKSDNNGCDLLIDIAGGVDGVSKFLQANNLDNIQINNFEREIQADWSVQFDNWVTPTAMVDLLKQLNNGKILQTKSMDFIWEVMMQSSTGSIKELIPSDIVVGYKTGYSGVGEDGVIAAQNCIGIMKYGEKSIAFAIFITDSNESKDVNMNIIAKLGEVIYKTFY